MFPAIRAEFLHFETLGCRLFVLRARVVPVLAFLTLECDDFSRHFSYPLSFELAQRAARIAVRLFAEKPKAFRHRLEQLWEHAR